MRLSIEKISPQEAARLLGTRPNPRGKHPKGRTQAYARVMCEGKWVVGDAIKINKKGELIDGFGRLQAVVLCEKPQTFAVIRNFPDNAIPVLDSGKIRDPAGLLAREGIRHSHNVRALIAGLIRLPKGGKALVTLLNSDYVPLYELYQTGIDPLIPFFLHKCGGPRIGFFVAAARAILCRPKDTARVVDAFRKLTELEFGAGDEPLRLLAKYLRSSQYALGKGAGQQQDGDYLKTARALESHLDGIPMKKLLAGNDPFPIELPF
ncbi:hypothetical protein ES708_02727 [subsurface metagenome]